MFTWYLLQGFAISDDQRDKTVTLTLKGQQEIQLKHGSVVIAAITSCTNTSNPSVMLAAALVAKKATEKGLKVRSRELRDVLNVGVMSRTRRLLIHCINTDLMSPAGKALRQGKPCAWLRSCDPLLGGQVGSSFGFFFFESIQVPPLEGDMLKKSICISVNAAERLLQVADVCRNILPNRDMCSGLLLSLESQGFHIVGYGCTTCIGNSGDIDESIAAAISDNGRLCLTRTNPADLTLQTSVALLKRHVFCFRLGLFWRN